MIKHNRKLSKSIAKSHQELPAKPELKTSDSDSTSEIVLVTNFPIGVLS